MYSTNTAGISFTEFIVPFMCCGGNDCLTRAQLDGYTSPPSLGASACPSTTVLSNTPQPTTPPSGSTKSSISPGPLTQPSALPTASGLSIGAAVGIVGSAVIALIIALSLGWIRRRRRNRKMQRESGGGHVVQEVVPMSVVSEVHGTSRVQELHGNDISETLTVTSRSVVSDL